MGDQLCCKKCQQPLKVVCDAHGTEWVPDRVTELPSLRKDRALKPKHVGIAQPAKVRPPAEPRTTTTQVSRVLAMMSTDPARPSSVADVVAAVGSDTKRMGIYLCILAKSGRIVRASTGKYYRAVT